MSSADDLFDDETLRLSPFCFPGSPEPCIPEPCIPLLDCLENESTELIPVSMNETNPLMSSQQSNLATYHETSTLLQNPLEMQQHQQQVLQQHQHQHQVLQQHQHQHQVLQQQPHQHQVLQQQQQQQQQHQHQVMQQQHQHQVLQQQQLGNSLELWLQNNLSNGFQSQSILDTFQEPIVFTRNQIEIGQVRQENNGYAHPTMANSPILLPAPLIHEERADAFGSLSRNHPTGSRNYLPYQTPQPVISSVNMYGQQPSPSIFTGRQNEPHTLRMVNNSAMTYPLQNQTNMIPTYNVVPQRNFSSIPRPHVSSNLTRLHGGMQGSVNQSSSMFRFPNLNNQTQIRPQMPMLPRGRDGPVRPYENSIIPPQNEVLGSKRQTYQNRFEFGQASTSAQRRRIEPEGGNVHPAAVNLVEQRQANNIYNPRYESLGLCIDPHLRNFFLRGQNKSC